MPIVRSRNDYHLGVRRADPARQARMLQLTIATPPTTPPVEHLAPVKRWVMGGNMDYGTCGPVCVANYIVMIYKNLLKQDVWVRNTAIYDLYRRSGSPNFYPHTPVDPKTGKVPGDNGVDMTLMLDALLKDGIQIMRADGKEEVVKPICYAKLALDLPTQYAAIGILGGVLWVVALQDSQQSQYRWHYEPSALWGYHAILAGADTQQTTGEDVAVISWADRIGTRDGFVKQQLVESYVPIFRLQWTHPDFMKGVDRAAFAKNYTAITGQPFPLPVS